MRFLEALDPRLRDSLQSTYLRRRAERVDPLPFGVTVVLVGHRAAGKSRLLGKIATALGRPAVDLDCEVERRSGRLLREWLVQDEAGFRRAEREVFTALPPHLVVAVGGGFFPAHAEVLTGFVAVLIPVSFDTYRERLLADGHRPRLRPQLTFEEELRQVFAERETWHSAPQLISLVDFVLRLECGFRPRRVVTLPPGEEAHGFALRAQRAGADLLEIRSDLQPAALELKPAARLLPLLIAQRTPTVPPQWADLAALFDCPSHFIPQGICRNRLLLSLHAEAPLSPNEAMERWKGVEVPSAGFIKHVEPLGELTSAGRLLQTRVLLAERFGRHQVTVLATGPLALPFRAVLAVDNALDYLALDASWAIIPGQRLLADAVREWRWPSGNRHTGRYGIVGHGIAHSQSPRFHKPPFDRIEVPENTDFLRMLGALRPFYQGLAVTTPFKRRAAQAVHASLPAVNTLVRVAHGYAGFSTDVAGAGAVLDALSARAVTVLGQGAVASALSAAAASRNTALRFIQASEVTDEPVRGAVLWTWPVDFIPPKALRFENATVAIIAYGQPAAHLTRLVRERNGVIRRLGLRWFIAQARAQRGIWSAHSEGELAL